jgi:hypothetical protein
VLKPVEPVDLAEKQRVVVQIEVPALAPPPGARTEETKWIGQNAHLYKGEWVAVQGSELISHGHDLHAVSAEADSKGVKRPLYYRVPKHLGEPHIGSL